MGQNTLIPTIQTQPDSDTESVLEVFEIKTLQFSYGKNRSVVSFALSYFWVVSFFCGCSAFLSRHPKTIDNFDKSRVLVESLHF